MKSNTSKKSLTASKPITNWDDAIFDPVQLVNDMAELADHYEGKRKLTLRTFTAAKPAPRFTPDAIARLREARNLSRPVFAQILNVPSVTVRKWESGERKPSGAALRLLEIMQRQPDALLRLAAG